MAVRKDNSYWFTHDCDASSDPKLIALIAKYDMAGYGRWWRLVEALRISDEYKYNISSKFGYPGLSQILRLGVDDCKNFIGDCIAEFDLLQTDGNFIWSNSLLLRMDKWDKKRETLSERGRKGAMAANAKKTVQAGAPDSTSENISTNSAVQPTEDELKAKELKEAYDNLPKDKTSIYHFINEHRPPFIEPYIAIWNIWATEYGKPKINTITDKRRRHLKARLSEKEFNILALLAKAKASEICRAGSWFNFDFLIKNSDGYIKLLEGNYDNKQQASPATAAAGSVADENFKKLLQPNGQK